MKSLVSLVGGLSFLLVCLGSNLGAQVAALKVPNLSDEAYAIYYHEPSAVTDHQKLLLGGETADDNSNNRWMPMRLANGSQYDCILPDESIGKEERSPTRWSSGEEIVQEAKLNQINRPFREHSPERRGSTKCMTKAAGWWSYELCWGYHLRQFHMGEKGMEGEHMLGLGPKTEGVKDLGANHSFYGGENVVHGHYVSSYYYNGSVCDLSGKQRSTEVRVHCKEDDTGEAFTFEISEPETCKYVVVVQSMEHCRIPELQKIQVYTHAINCYRRPSAEEQAAEASSTSVEEVSSSRNGMKASQDVEESSEKGEKDDETVPIDLGL